MGRKAGYSNGRNDSLTKALAQAAREEGFTGQPIPIPTWERIVLKTFGTRTRQSCHDITWAMDRQGFIQWEKGVSVTFAELDEALT